MGMGILGRTRREQENGEEKKTSTGDFAFFFFYWYRVSSFYFWYFWYKAKLYVFYQHMQVRRTSGPANPYPLVFDACINVS